MVSLENKCTLVAFYDAIAYQYPRKMMELGVDSPRAFVEIVVQAGLPFEKFKETSIFSNNLLKQLRDWYRSNNSSQGHPYIWPILCYFMGIDVYTCTKDIVNDMSTEGTAIYKRLLSHMPQSKDCLYNIESVGAIPRTSTFTTSSLHFLTARQRKQSHCKYLYIKRKQRYSII